MRFLVFLFGLAAAPAFALDAPQTPLVDPMGSFQWDYMQKNMFEDPKDIRFDDRVIVLAPVSAEDSFHVPVQIDATAVPDVRRIIVAVDYGPIPKILTYYPEQAQAKLAFRFKIDQATPIRAVVETHAGTWHVGGTNIDAAGGGCTAPAAAYADADWEADLGKVYGRIWPEAGRVRVKVSHPMDTGLADGIPVFILEELGLQNDVGEDMAKLELYEPINEDPTFTFFFDSGLERSMRVVGRDNNGNTIDATIHELQMSQ